jgi:hypothetical protein
MSVTVSRGAPLRLLPVIGLVIALGLDSGCAGPSLHTCSYSGTSQVVACPEPQIERGEPRPVLDTVGWVVGVPSKIIMLDHRVNNHNVCQPTETAVRDYLARNGLDDVKVRINEYDPGGEWRRLTENKSVGWPIRYSLGTLTVVGYAVFPGRVFGGDHYNPFTNTISLYSDVPALAVFEGGHAKDYAAREYKGLYAMATALPGINLLPETRACDDTIAYIRTFGTPDEMKDGYRSVYPAYAVSATQPLASATGLPLVLPAVAVGHLAGQITAARVPKSDDAPQCISVATVPTPAR